MYLKVHLSHGRQKNDLLTQHDFRLEITIYWIIEDYTRRNAVKERPIVVRRKRKSTHVSTGWTSTISSLTQVTPTRKKKACGVTDIYLCPEAGSLKTRLNCLIDHIPDNSKPNARCSLHRWLSIETQKSISYCHGCNINLCLQWYSIFNKQRDIIGSRLSLSNKYKKKIKIITSYVVLH